jgi:hypothetical protein
MGTIPPRNLIFRSEGDMTLGRAVEESQRAINYFFNNQFIEAKNLMTP